MRPLTTLLIALNPLSTAYVLDPSTLHPPGTPMTQYTPSGSIMHPSPPYRPWLTTLRDSGRSNDRDIPQPTWYRPHPHVSYHNTTYQLSQPSSPQTFTPQFSEFDDPAYIFSFLSDVEQQQERSFLMSQVDDLDSLPRGAKICLVVAVILFAYLLMDTLVEAVVGWLFETAEARAERKKERGRRIVKRWRERYSLIGAVRRWDEMTRLQMGITPGGQNSERPVRPLIEMPMMRRSVETRRVETVRTERHVPYSAEAMRQMQEEINQLPVHQEGVPPRRPFGGMPGSPLWFANKARRAFRSRG